MTVTNYDISQDSALIVSGSLDKSLKIWGMDFGDCHKTFPAHTNMLLLLLNLSLILIFLFLRQKIVI